MYLRVKWVNRNINLDEIRIYRSESTMTKDSLPAVFATLPGDSEQFIDENVVRDNVYFYFIEFVRGLDKTFSRQVKLKATVSSGPGPSDLISGNNDAGYFGLFDASDFIPNEEIGNHLPVLAPNLYPPLWIKYVYEGRICFVPYRTTFKGAGYTWRNAYAAGQVFGVDGPGEAIGFDLGTPPVNQLYVIEFSGYRFKVRLMESEPYDHVYSSNPSLSGGYFPTRSDPTIPFPKNEFDSVFRRLFITNGNNPQGGRLASLSPNHLLMNSSTSILTQNLRSRGSFNPYISWSLNSRLNATNTASFANYFDNSTVTPVALPVLELIQ